jgi:hypothetical protein
MKVVSLVTGTELELDFAESISDWQDPVNTADVEMPSGPEWMDAYLLQLALQEVK